ncbi:MAG: sensor histidine kinase [Clostridia bacterium]
MDIKLKTLVTKNSKLKAISLFLLFVFMSICFEVLFNLSYNYYSWYREATSIPEFYLFGRVKRMPASDIVSSQQYLAMITGILCVIFFVLYKLNSKTNIKILDKIISISSGLSIETNLLVLGFILLGRYIHWSSTIDFYDTYLVMFDFVILWGVYIFYNGVILNIENLKPRLLIFNLIIGIFGKYNKKSINKKIALVFLITIIIEFILAFSLFSTMSYFGTGFAIASILSIFNIIYFSYLYKFLSKRFIYIDYICNKIKLIEDGNLNYKLDVKGNDEISSLASSINNITNGLENAVDSKLKSEKMKTELITNVSHDLKTPLTSIVNYVDILKNNELDKATTKDYIDILDKKSQRLKALVEDIFEASKISSGDIELNIEKTDVKELLIQSIVELEDKISDSKLDFIINVPHEAVFTMIDGKKSWRVFENLILNITKYSILGTRVYIDLSLDDENIFISMKNMSNYKLNISPKEFLERFRRGDVSRNTEGSGLGLSIADNLMSLQGGNLDIYIDGDLFKSVLKFKCINDNSK